MSSNTRSEPETAKSHFFNYVKKPFFLTMIFKDIAFFFDYSRPIGKQLVSSSNPTGGTLVM